MSELFEALDERLTEFIENQKVYFVATAPSDGEHINLSPKGLDSLKVVNPTQVAWLNLTGSGNESAAHVLENGRMTLMFCSFEKQPLILRLYGTARVIHPRDKQWSDFYPMFTPSVSARQIFVLDISRVQTSCGFAVPFFDFAGERDTLTKWAESRSESDIEEYWEKKNQTSLDGMPTHIIKAGNED